MDYILLFWMNIVLQGQKSAVVDEYLSHQMNIISPLECYMWLSALKQLFRRHKKQFSALFLELDNK
jgi:hypothetical protein